MIYAVTAVTALTPTVSAGSASDRALLQELRRADVRLASVAFRLATRAGPLCARTDPKSGMLVHDAPQYAAALRAEAAAVFGFGAGAGIEAVVSGSPADLAGLRANDRLVRIDGQSVVTAPAGPGATMSSVTTLREQLSAALAAGQASVDVIRDNIATTVSFSGIPGCVSDVELVPEKRHNAAADGRVVVISTAVLDDTASDDELAFLVAHEMSHNILGHRAQLDRAGVHRGLLGSFGKDARQIRQTEQQADLMGLYLMARAGYDPAAAARFWQRFDDAHGLGIFADATHMNGAARVRFLQLGADEIARGEPGVIDQAPDMGHVAALAAAAGKPHPAGGAP